jgi:hypothetical protein
MRFIQNHIADSDSGFVDEATLDWTTAHFAERLGESKRAIAVCAFVLDVLSTCWSCEMNCVPDRIEAGLQVAATLARYVERV